VLHLRVLAPAALTDTVLSMIEQHVGTANVTVVRGAGHGDAADLVEAQVAREAADELLDRLCDAGLADSGAITVLPIDLELSAAAERAQADAPGSGTDALVWEEVAARTGEDSELTGVYLAFLVIATMLAAIGVVTDSLITVVGAMVVGPEFGPLAALAVGAVDRRWRLVRRAGLALLVGFPVAMLVTAAATAIGRASGLVDVDALGSLARATDFIFHPGPYSLIVALLAGAVGMLSLTSGKSAALVGVFISVTTVPAAGYVAVALVSGEPHRAWGSVVQLVVNLAGITVAAAVVLVIRRFAARRAPARRRANRVPVRRPPLPVSPALVRAVRPWLTRPDRRVRSGATGGPVGGSVTGDPSRSREGRGQPE
jgi:uncharacterized hydrophobic protein (TIGR00271 family)